MQYIQMYAYDFFSQLFKQQIEINQMFYLFIEQEVTISHKKCMCYFLESKVSQFSITFQGNIIEHKP